MCIVALALGRHPDWPLVIAANRDEFHQRPALPAAPWTDAASIVGGRDLEAGGSWLAMRADGRFAAVTNVRRPGVPRGARSRGDLVSDLVRADAGPAAWLAALNGQRGDYAPFNLVVGDAGMVWWLESESGAHGRFAPGVHAFSNGPVGAPWPKCQGVASALARALADTRPRVDTIMAALADTSVAADAELPDTGVGLEMERFLSPVHIVGDRYGTRASTVLALAADGAHRLLERRFGPGGVCEGESAWRTDAKGWTSSAWPEVL
ncbi:MAG TPA: NRDE family protein [Xanthomonadaceae bacterium]|nr:NRDE family protein [Xanthomonadaceae bacterium]